MSDLVPRDSSFDQIDALLTQQIQGNTLALETLRQHNRKIAELDAVKADRRDVRALEAELATVYSRLHSVEHSRDYYTVVAFEDLISAKFQDRGKIGQAFSALSRELGIDKRLRPDDRFGSIGTYHPFVCRVFCERHGYPLHPVLKQALDPR